MLKFLKSLFAKEEPVPTEHVKLEQLEEWFQHQVGNLDLGGAIKEYFKQLAYLKDQLIEKTRSLQTEELAKEHKNVEPRVKNIVLGHRNNYSKMNQIFAEGLKVQDREFKTIDELDELYGYNMDLDKRLDELAKQTAKSYQAAQHLFFKTVESIFKQLQELNKLVKDFRTKLEEKGVHRLVEFQEEIANLHGEGKKRESFEQKLKERETAVPELEKDLGRMETELKTIEQSDEHRAYKELLRRKDIINKQLKEVEQEIFSYFSKLGKPLRRYERIAIDHKLIGLYNEDFVKAFWNDKEMQILVALEGMKGNLQNLRFDSKHQENFKLLIEKAEVLHSLREKGSTLQERMGKIDKSIENSNIVEKINSLNNRIEVVSNKIKVVKEEIPNMKQNIQEADPQNKVEIISEKAKEIFGKEIIIN